MIDHEELIKKLAEHVRRRGYFPSVSTEEANALADALEARVLSPSEGDFGLLGPKEALHAAAEGECEPAGWDYESWIHDSDMESR